MPRRIEFQDRDEWLKWRMQGIGSSDVPVILGLSPYKTAFQLFEEKTGRRQPAEVSNPAITRGIELEPIARAKFAALYGFLNDVDDDFEAANLISEDDPHQRVSLDGLSRDGQTLIEIKHQGQLAHETFKMSGVLRPDYMAQVQYQLYVSNALTAYVVSIKEDHSIAYHQIRRDVLKTIKIVEAVDEFWRQVKAAKWDAEQDQHLQLFERWRELSDEIKHLEAERKKIQNQIFESDVEVCGNYRVIAVERRGSIKYSAIDALEGVDLESYREPSVNYKTIKFIKA